MDEKNIPAEDDANVALRLSKVYPEFRTAADRR